LHFLIVGTIRAEFLLELLRRSIWVMAYLLIQELAFLLRIMERVAGLVIDGERKGKGLRVRERGGRSRERAVRPVSKLVEGFKGKVKLTASSSSTHLVILLLNI